MGQPFDSKLAQVGLLIAIAAAVTVAVAIGTASWAPFAATLIWLPAIYVAIYQRRPVRRNHDHS